MLARRLIRRGMTLSVGTLAAGLPSEVSAPCAALAGCFHHEDSKGVHRPIGGGAGPRRRPNGRSHKSDVCYETEKGDCGCDGRFLSLLECRGMAIRLGGGTRKRRNAEGQSNAPKQSPPQVAGTKDEAKALPIPSGKRSFQTDLCLTRIKNGRRSTGLSRDQSPETVRKPPLELGLTMSTASITVSARRFEGPTFGLGFVPATAASSASF